MNHQFRGVHKGLIVLDEFQEVSSSDEFRVIVDPYAAEAMRFCMPNNYRLLELYDHCLRELQGWERSYYSLEKHVNAILEYDHEKLPEPTDDFWNQTKEHILTEFKRMDTVQAKSYQNFDGVKWVQSSAAGYGYCGRKGDCDNYERAKGTAILIAECLDHDRNYGPKALLESTQDVAFMRTQLSQVKVKTKVRNEWGEAFHYVLLEGLFVDPLIEYFKKAETFYCIGHGPLLAVPGLIHDILTDKDYIYLFDWFNFNASVQEWEIRFAFQCLETLLHFPSKAEAEIWRFLIELFIYRKIAGPNGVLYLKTHGIPGGSRFTNIIGSIVNYVRIQYMFKRLTSNFVDTVFTHGDDSLAGVDTTQYIRIDSFDQVCGPLNWKRDKSRVYVSSLYNENSFLHYSVIERQNIRTELLCLRMLLYPECQVHSGDVSARRAMNIYKYAGLHNKYLLSIFKYLKDKYGVARVLPTHLRVWDSIESEFRRAFVSESM